MMPPDVISHENQLQHLFQTSIFILDVFRTADHAGQIFIPHRPPPVAETCGTLESHNEIKTDNSSADEGFQVQCLLEFRFRVHSYLFKVC